MAFGKRKGGGRRSSSRQTAPLLAVVTTLQQTHSVTLVDVSQTGARLRGDDLPDPGDELFLTVESVRCFGSVAWKLADECGVAFHDPLPPLDVEIIRHMAITGRDITPEQRAAFEDWTLGRAQ